MKNKLGALAFLLSGGLWKHAPTFQATDDTGRSFFLRHVIGEQTAMEAGIGRVRVARMRGCI